MVVYRFRRKYRVRLACHGLVAASVKQTVHDYASGDRFVARKPRSLLAMTPPRSGLRLASLCLTTRTWLFLRCCSVNICVS